MLKFFRLGLLTLIVAGLHVQSASACRWWKSKRYNSCCASKCQSPCYTPCSSRCRSSAPFCDPCMGFVAPGNSYPTPAGPPIQSGYKMNGPAMSNGMVLPQNTITNMPAQGTTVPMMPQSMSPFQGSTPQTWYVNPNTVTPNSTSEIKLPPQAEALDSTQIEWQTIQSKGATTLVPKQPSFENVTLQSQKRQIRPSRKRSVRAPSAVAVWQHMNSAR